MIHVVRRMRSRQGRPDSGVVLPFVIVSVSLLLAGLALLVAW